jgi:hypothetical protein
MKKLIFILLILVSVCVYIEHRTYKKIKIKKLKLSLLPILL